MGGRGGRIKIFVKYFQTQCLLIFFKTNTNNKVRRNTQPLKIFVCNLFSRENFPICYKIIMELCSLLGVFKFKTHTKKIIRISNRLQQTFHQKWMDQFCITNFTLFWSHHMSCVLPVIKIFSNLPNVSLKAYYYSNRVK